MDMSNTTNIGSRDNIHPRAEPGVHTSVEHADTMKRVGRFIFRYGLAMIFVWAGFLKFFAFEAKNIEPMVTNSPIWSWAIPILELQGLSIVIGIIEISIGVLIATRSFWPKVSAIGSIGAIITFLITLSFMLTTPGVWEPGYGFGFLSALPGQFLAKDLVLLGVSIWTAGEALQAAADRFQNSSANRV